MSKRGCYSLALRSNYMGRQETEDQETEENALNSDHYHANKTSVTMQPCLQETPVTFLINLPH